MEESSQESGISQTNNENTHNSSQSIENSTRFETISIKSSKSNTNVSTSSETQINISDTTPLRTSNLQEDTEYVELEFNNGGNNIRCYTEEEVPELPNDLVVGDDNNSCSKKRGLSSDQALEQVFISNNCFFFPIYSNNIFLLENLLKLQVKYSRDIKIIFRFQHVNA